MKILPAIDILNGKVVRLLKGNFNDVTEYSNNPLDIAARFLEQGFNHIHLIDLEGAKEGKTHLIPIVQQMKALGITLQIGGGIRSLEIAEKYIAAGASQIIISTAALSDHSFYWGMIEKIGEDKLILSLDVINGKVAINGWKNTLNFTIPEIIEELNPKAVIITDISKDGTLAGVDINMYQEILNQFPEIHLIAAGGVSSMETIKKLETIGIRGAIVGKAFYENEQFRNEIIKNR